MWASSLHLLQPFHASSNGCSPLDHYVNSATMALYAPCHVLRQSRSCYRTARTLTPREKVAMAPFPTYYPLQHPESVSEHNRQFGRSSTDAENLQPYWTHRGTHIGIYRATRTHLGKCPIPAGHAVGRTHSKYRPIPAGHAVCFREEPSVTQSSSPASSAADTVLSCTTFNILAPIYKRINNEGCRESQFRDCWINRNQGILEMLLINGSSIICLQEFWHGNDELVQLYDESLARAGYQTYKLARTNNRGDGLLTAIKHDRLTVLNYRKLVFNDCGDRVAQIFHLQLRLPDCKESQNSQLELLVVNTHLLFPHDFSYCLIRLRQVYKIMECLQQFKIENKLGAVPVILCGDWNGSKRGRVYKFLRSQGFLSSFDTARGYTDADAHYWISHRNHLGNTCEVDFIWLLPSRVHQKSLSESWMEAMIGTIKAKMCKTGLAGKDGFVFFNPDGDSLTFHAFYQGLNDLGLTASCSEGFTRAEVEELMQSIDTNKNGLIDYIEFKSFFDLDPSVPNTGKVMADSDSHLGLPVAYPALTAMAEGISKVVSGEPQVEFDRVTEMQKGVEGFAIKEAFLFPLEAEQGFWPDSYTLSDHAALTATFTLQRCAVV